MNALVANVSRPCAPGTPVAGRRPRRPIGPALLALLSLLVPFGAGAAGDALAGKEKAATCASCHGAEGIATAENYPTLAGQYETYLVHALKSYRSGSRQNAIMYGFASQLSDEDIADLAAWYASQTGPLKTAPLP